MQLEEIKLESQKMYEGKILQVYEDTVQLPNGQKSKRELVKHPGGVCVASLTDQNEVLMVKQYRYPYSTVLLELPAGKLEAETTPLENIKRELKEETGAIGSHYISLGQLYPSPGYCAEIIYLYACRIHHIEKACLDPDEFLEVYKIPIQEAFDLVIKNQICDAKSQVAILKTMILIQQGVL